MFNGLSVQPADLPHLLCELAIGRLTQPAIQAVGRCGGVVRCTHRGIECLGLLLRHAALIIVIGRRQQEVAAATLHGALWHHLRIEDDGRDLLEPSVHRLSLTHGHMLRVEAANALREVICGESGGLELVLAVMMMNTVSEPYALEVCLQGFELCIAPIAPIFPVDSLQRSPNSQIVAAVLIEDYITPHQGGFREVIEQLLLLQR